ncbi:MAG: DUF433 domain-containing protein [Candidatus Brocadiales bacterium]
MKGYRNRIKVDPQVHFGKPYVAGTRITVDNVLELVQEGASFEEITRNYYPDLEIEDIKACIQYALDLIRKEEIHA